MKSRLCRIFDKRLDGFSLMEISIVLLIIGVIAGGMLKGRDLIEVAQVRSVVNDYQNIQNVIESYINSYGTLPGDDARASEKFQNVSNGDGDGIISESDAKKVPEHLFAAGLIDSKDFKAPRLGGKYDIVSEDGDIKLRISNNGKAVLSKRQTLALISKINEMFGNSATPIETVPEISSNANQKYAIKMKIK